MVQRKIPPAELEVLACLQRLREATAREIREAMHGYRPMAHGSVVTLLKRLELKSLVTKRKGSAGKAFLYRPTRGMKPTYQDLLKRIRQRIFGGDSVALVASLYESRPPTEAELRELERLLARLKDESSGKGGKK
jgi:BlaI family transcriptional regulator, penicillinase repressor